MPATFLQQWLHKNILTMKFTMQNLDNKTLQLYLVLKYFYLEVAISLFIKLS